MRVTLKDVEKIASLAKLNIPADEKAMYREQLEEMLDYVDQLNGLDTEAVEPTFYVQHPADTVREDRAAPCLRAPEALANAPAQSHGFFRVPKVVTRPEKEE
jgi:aspartyl-tRNA(Asn)/glutamyl-tRNA(Gln) amidotransferase subunit C